MLKDCFIETRHSFSIIFDLTSVGLRRIEDEVPRHPAVSCSHVSHMFAPGKASSVHVLCSHASTDRLLATEV